MSLDNLQGKKRHKPNNQLTQLDRQLLIYEIFYFCQEISFEEIRSRIPIDIRTMQRDIADLTAAGLISVRYAKDVNAYVHVPIKENPPTDKKAEYSIKKQQHIERLARIGKLMFELKSDEVAEFSNYGETFDRSKYRSCREYYFEMFPEATPRMMQHDFEELRRIGYRIDYIREIDMYEMYVTGNIREDFGIREVDGILLLTEGFELDKDGLWMDWEAYKWDIEES